MTNRKVHNLTAFVPARDFALSRRVRAHRGWMDDSPTALPRAPVNVSVRYPFWILRFVRVTCDARRVDWPKPFDAAPQPSPIIGACFSHATRARTSRGARLSLAYRDDEGILSR